MIRPESSIAGVSLCALTLSYFVFVMLYVLNTWRITGHRQNLSAKLEGYGHFFLMSQCNMYFQLTNLSLHIFAHFTPAYKLWRDRVYTLVALPFSLSTTLCFWVMWFCVGRSRVNFEDQIVLHPFWVIHGLHTISPCVNLVLQRLVAHKFSPNPRLFSYLFLGIHLYAASLIYAYTGSFQHAFIKSFTRLETTIYYLGFAVVSHLCYVFVYATEDFFNFESEYQAIVEKRVAEAEREIMSAPTPISRTPTPLFIIPRESPILTIPVGGELREDSPEIIIPSAYRPRAAAVQASPKPSTSRASLGRRKADKKNN